MTHLSDDTLNTYLDDALPPANRAQAASHLQTCPQCTARLATLSSLFASLDALPDLPIQRDLSTSVLAAIRPAQAPAPARPSFTPGFTLAFGIQLLLALIATAIALPFALRLAPTIPAFNGFDIFNNTLQRLVALFQSFTSLPNPANFIPTNLSSLFTSLPSLTLSTTLLAFCLAGVTLIWFIGNGLLLRATTQPQHN